MTQPLRRTTGALDQATASARTLSGALGQVGRDFDVIGQTAKQVIVPYQQLRD